MKQTWLETSACLGIEKVSCPYRYGFSARFHSVRRGHAEDRLDKWLLLLGEDSS